MCLLGQKVQRIFPASVFQCCSVQSAGVRKKGSDEPTSWISNGLGVWSGSALLHWNCGRPCCQAMYGLHEALQSECCRQLEGRTSCRRASCSRRGPGLGWVGLTRTGSEQHESGRLNAVRCSSFSLVIYLGRPIGVWCGLAKRATHCHALPRSPHPQQFVAVQL